MRDEGFFQRIIGRKALIVGEAGTGKTKLLASFLDYLIERGFLREVTVIDMAPKAREEIGGTLDSYTISVDKVRYLKPWRIIPPRLTGRDAKEVLSYAKLNHQALKPLVEEYLKEPTKILLINDITIYLHAGDVEDLVKVIKASETFAATAYQGVRLRDDKGSGITEREREGLERLRKHVDEVVEL